MKKLLISTIIAVALYGCDEISDSTHQNRQSIENDYQKQGPISNVRPFETRKLFTYGTFACGNIATIEGHDYIILTDEKAIFMCHAASCPCYNKEDVR